ncbi:CoA-binding protein [Streptomyces yaizuensis]|uniref:CoA-binding protein n=1 Tax=Streptomyces yaizuensis TaxID=2989713 RepID=A0ABQ5NZB5_9ACTN|nr:CoA-binding protein [Streptomyces sp. YSPA8]GLF95698.1 CoA-binding protein [Streptomyces sp. YSPA8]
MNADHGQDRAQDTAGTGTTGTDTTGTDTAGRDTGAAVERILTATGDTWAVVGLSNNTSRAAYGVARVLKDFGKRVVPVHPKAETVHGERGYASLDQIPFPVDVVDVFVNADLAGQVADEAVAIGAKAVWFQLGVVDDGAYARTRAAGLDMVMDRCPAIEIPALGGGAR